VRYHALAVDYDGTLARHGEVDSTTIEVLQELRSSGRKIILVTGREIPDLFKTFNGSPEIFDRIVAENGALLYRPASREEKLLGMPPPPEFAEELRRRGVHPLSVGKVVVATFEPFDGVVLQVIRESGLELQVIFNKGAVMVLPSGINKATGLTAALRELGLSHHNVIAAGDAENDHALLELCECGVAVANALPPLKQHADYVSSESHGAGVAETARKLLLDDFEEIAPRLHRHDIQLGVQTDNQPVLLSPYGPAVLVAGRSGGGKSTLVTSFLERLIDKDYQAFVLDPEGDYPELPRSLVLGDTHQPPSSTEILHGLERPRQNVIANIIGVKLEDRPLYFQRLLLDLLKLRGRTGRPHWIIIDETHHVLPANWRASSDIDPQSFKQIMAVTLTPHHVAPSLLKAVDLVIGIGSEGKHSISEFASLVSAQAPDLAIGDPDPGEAIGWWRGSPETFCFRTLPPETVRRRHVRKYMKGELVPDESFYFEGPNKKLHLRAQNLQLFMQISEGVDPETWVHHLKKGDFSKWFRNCIKDEELAKAAERIEQDASLSPEESREQIRHQIEERYTAPA
jgi:hydroxymethylpyrimidine pyrophosphatase-like HAD family hydrolase